MSKEKVIDPHNNKQRFQKWKKNKRIEGINLQNNKAIIQYIDDMQIGINTSESHKKGSRSFSRLNALRSRLTLITQLVEKYAKKDLLKVEERDIAKIFGKMRDGTIRKKDKQPYKSVADYVKVFKAFWHWHMKKSRKKGIDIRDITTDMDASREKPKFNFFSEEGLSKLMNHAKYEYKVLMYFLYDTGIRAPTELVNVKLSDLKFIEKDNIYELSIRDETSKTFGRKIKLLLCSKLLKQYIKEKEIKQNDFVFPISLHVCNQYLKRIGQRILKTTNLTLYDFRHSSACYWLRRYKSESGLKYRFGWKKSDMIHYYTEFLGMKDDIQEEDLIVDISKTEIEKELDRSNTERLKQQEIIDSLLKRTAKLEKTEHLLKSNRKYMEKIMKG